jgi:hypothetical protein
MVRLMTAIDPTLLYFYYLAAAIALVLSLMFWIMLFILIINGNRALKVYVRSTDMRDEMLIADRRKAREQ